MRAELARLFGYGRERFTVVARLVRRFRRWGLTMPAAVFDLPGEVVSGHADRHVVRVIVGDGDRRIGAYLKREHRVRFRDRMAAWWNGHGSVSLSEREGRILAALRRADVPVPRVLAMGECDGRAFLLLSAIRGALDLRHFLRRMGAAIPEHRRATLARRLGTILARVHGAKLDAPDLLSKHVLIHPHSLAISLLDWARSRFRNRVSLRISARDLGRLHASLTDALATPGDRLRCLRAYWQQRGGIAFASFRDLILATERAGRIALRRRSVRELRRPAVEERPQQLRWLDGERLCLTLPFWRASRGTSPAWLTAASCSRVLTARSDNVFWHGARLRLQRWPAAAPWRRLVARIAGRRADTVLTRQAGLLFRLRRYGVPAPRVLAFGRRPDGSGFLLTRPIPETQPLTECLESFGPRRLAVLTKTGALLRKLHAAGHRLEQRIDALVVRDQRLPALAEGDLRPMPRPAGRWPLRDLGVVIRALRLIGADAASFVRGYLGGESSVREGLELAAALRGQLPTPPGARDE
jgi:tRNA A-37 threonylcarbamoyl transferase component Bud32